MARCIAAKSYDCETGLLRSNAGCAALSGIVASRSLGDLTGDTPQATTSTSAIPASPAPWPGSRPTGRSPRAASGWTLVIIGLAVAVGGLVDYGIPRENGTNRSDTAHKFYVSHPPDPTTTTLKDSAEVFRHTFWQRPSPDDRILLAERREWSDENGLQPVHREL